MSETSEGLPLRWLGGLGPLRLHGAETERPTSGPIPDRYEIRDIDGRHFLRCKEAPGLVASVDRNHAFSEAEAKKMGERTIFLDGAARFAPLVDDARHLYNLDHHEGVVRAFTLAACEQALVLVVKGLELDKGDWTVYANEPDLDTVFALWVLFNHRRVRELSPTARDAVLPLLRLEAAIDANGLDVAEYSGLTVAQLEVEKARLDRLHARELELKKSGEWESIDLAQYTARMLFEIDRMVFTDADFSDFTSVEKEYGHVDIGHDKVAVICRDQAGIYDVEKRLKKVWGDRLGLIALETSPARYTLRRAAALGGIDLEAAYERLNLLDPAVDGRPAEKRWGGSDDIGGSPRPGGTGLVPREVGKILRLAYKPPRPWMRVQRLLSMTLWVLGIVLAGGLAGLAWEVWVASDHPIAHAAAQLVAFSSVVAIASWFLTRRLSRGWVWLFGWRRPAGRDWLYPAPLALAAALAGGVWVAPPVRLDGGHLPTVLAATALAALAATLLFPGLGHGLLVLDARIQSAGGRWFVSRPTAMTAALYALVTTAASRFLVAGSPLADGWKDVATVAAASLVVGLVAGIARERSLSLVPPFLLLLTGALLRLAFAGGLPW